MHIVYGPHIRREGGRGSEREDGVSRIRERTKAGREKVRVGMLKIVNRKEKERKGGGGGDRTRVGRKR